VGFATAIAVSAVTARVLTLAAVVFAPAAAQAADAQAGGASAIVFAFVDNKCNTYRQVW